MRIIKKYWIFCFMLAFVMVQSSACKTGEGCEATDHYKAQTDKEGNLSGKRGKSNLFSKKKRKKMRK